MNFRQKMEERDINKGFDDMRRGRISRLKRMGGAMVKVKIRRVRKVQPTEVLA